MRIRLVIGSVLLLLTGAGHAQTPAAQLPAPDATAQSDLDHKAAPTALFVKFRVKPGRNAAFEAAFREMQTAIREKEPGNLYYDLFVTPEDPQLYVIMERYRDASAVAAHNQTGHIKKVLTDLRDLLAAPLEPQRLIFVSSK